MSNAAEWRQNAKKSDFILMLIDMVHGLNVREHASLSIIGWTYLSAAERIKRYHSVFKTQGMIHKNDAFGA